MLQRSSRRPKAEAINGHGRCNGMKHWTLDDIPWDHFEPSKADGDLLAVVRTASLVERNAADYATYLCNVFPDDPGFQAAARTWAEEEAQHGEALGRWAEMAGAGFDFREAFRRFTEGYRIPVESSASVRGSRWAELVARCVVESGTSSFYSALRDASDEPVLRDICRRIAGDEFRHYRLFYDNLQRYLARERPWRARRLLIACGRFFEVGDDELSFAYHCANEPDAPYVRAKANEAYTRRASRYYRRSHVQRAMGMILKASGVDPAGWLGTMATHLAWRHVQRRQRLPLAA
jgi:rubrerythrin